uniref:Rad60/SUMO-like domain-containing protein n=1 Tax=Scophthalmus maximus TaxID=52904 RepID=A0A8D3CHH6_SCOMX
RKWSCQRKPQSTTVRFHFDGAKVTHSQTPAQLDMEDGDIVETPGRPGTGP